MKKMLISLGSLAMLSTPVITLGQHAANTTHQQEVVTEVNNSLNIILNQNYDKMDASIQGGRDGYDYYFGYHVLWFSHETTEHLELSVIEGSAAVAAIIIAAIPAAAPIAAVVAGLIVLQWVAWNPPSYDAGAGIYISFVGFAIPQYIVEIGAQ